jgi:hypothetical protein
MNLLDTVVTLLNVASAGWCLAYGIIGLRDKNASWGPATAFAFSGLNIGLVIVRLAS